MKLANQVEIKILFDDLSFKGRCVANKTDHMMQYFLILDNFIGSVKFDEYQHLLIQFLNIRRG